MRWMDLEKPILALAPMADMTDSPFCRVCRELAAASATPPVPPLGKRGMDSEVTSPQPSPCKGEGGERFVIFREMVSAEAIVRGSEKTLKMCEFEEIERPIVIQIFGGKAETIARAARVIVDKFHPDGIDVNMGCPVPKIAAKNLAGACLMKDHDRACEIVRALKAENLGVPISVKTRLGWTKPDEILEFAPRLEQAGADLITIHGRTRSQGYAGVADWEMIGRAKKLVKIPVLANGDVNTREDVVECLRVTGADGVMIGRGALGRPWVFQEFPISNFQFPIKELKKIILRHAQLHLARYGENSMTTFRKHLLLYFKGVAGMKEVKMKLAKVETIEELNEILKKLPQ